MRRAAKRDDTEPDILAALRAAGATVQQLSGEGVPDLLVGYKGRTFLMECKGPEGRLTGAQVLWLAWWRGAPVAEVRSPHEAIAAIQGKY